MPEVYFRSSLRFYVFTVCITEMILFKLTQDFSFEEKYKKCNSKVTLHMYIRWKENIVTET